MFTQMHARSAAAVAPAPSSLQSRTPLSWVARRSYAEQKIKRERQSWEEPEEEDVFDDQGRRLFGDQIKKYREEKAEEEAAAKIIREKNRTTMNVQEDREAGTRGEIRRINTRVQRWGGNEETDKRAESVGQDCRHAFLNLSTRSVRIFFCLSLLQIRLRFFVS